MELKQGLGCINILIFINSFTLDQNLETNCLSNEDVAGKGVSHSWSCGILRSLHLLYQIKELNKHVINIAVLA